MAGTNGEVFAFGADQYWGSLPDESVRPAAPIVGTAAFGTSGYWLAGSDGGIFAIGSCIPFYGSMAGHHLNAPVVGIATAPEVHPGGYWLAAADGGVFTFGSARYFGSAAHLHLRAPIVGIAATGDGGGYWLAAADGGVFSFGDAVFEGSAVGRADGRIVGIASRVSSKTGYWLASARGGVFAFGTARYEGSASNLTLAAPIVGVAPAQQVYTCSTSSGDTSEGYWLAGADGGVFSFGSATYQGSETKSRLASPIVAIESGAQPSPSCPAPR